MSIDPACGAAKYMSRAPFATLRLVVFLACGLGAAADHPFRYRLEPNWFAGESQFWYRADLPGRAKRFFVVEADSGEGRPAFDHDRLAAALGKVGLKCRADRLPFDSITFGEGGETFAFPMRGHMWTCVLSDYSLTKGKAAPDPGRAGGRPGRRGRFGERASPDGKWVASVRDGDVYVRAGGDVTRLTKDGSAEKPFGLLTWSPDSKTLVAFRVEPGEGKQVHLVESSPRGGGRARLSSRTYPLPGDKFTAYRPVLFRVGAGERVDPKADPIDFGRPRVRWDKGGRSFTYNQVDRGHQRFRLVRIDAEAGGVTNVIDEKSETFIWTAHARSLGVPRVTWLKQSDELIHMTERDGWRHLYLVDAADGRVKNLITPGEYVVRGVVHIDEEKRQLWFTANGGKPGQDPYFIHYYRVNFDGTGLTALTAGDGTHSVQFSPTREYLIDTYSRVDQPPVRELRRGRDGSLIRELGRADAAGLKEAGWRPPTVFTAKGRDGETDIWGVIYKPRDFDPAKKYPVVEHIYAGPHDAHVPKRFGRGRRHADLTEAGFVVVQIDGMGTAHRSKKFHDVCWHNLKDAGLPDRVLWHKAAAKKFPWYDADRVGVVGCSAGGQNAMAAVLFHGDFYDAAVAACGCHDNRMDKASWNEQWMGYPVGPHYAANSNVDNAHRLKGRLMLIVGEMDRNVPPESTYRVVDALIKADKDFDFVMVPGAGHGWGGRFGRRKMKMFLREHLVNSPDR